MLLPCIFAQSMVYARVAIDVLAPMCWHVISGACVLGHAVARSSTDMRVCANRNRKRSCRLPHAHLRVRIRMRVRARSCVRESLCLHSHMYAHA